MRETAKSLRAYFLFAGLIAELLALRDVTSASQLGSLGGALPPSWMLAIWFPILAHVILGCAYIWAGIRLPVELARGAGWIKTMLLASIVVLVIDVVLTGYVLGIELARVGMTTPLIGLAISAYLLANVRRLADEAMAKQPPQARVT